MMNEENRKLIEKIHKDIEKLPTTTEYVVLIALAMIAILLLYQLAKA
jgi:hypothetical protein